MSSLDEILAPLMGQHRDALAWFHERRGTQVRWSELNEHADRGVRLATKAKGIYKPRSLAYALSVRTLQNGPYPDKAAEFRPDGSWVVQYHQENPDVSKRDQEYTNVGMMQCLNDRVPVGFLIKRKGKPDVEYEVLGLGLVTGWENGYFTIEGFANDGSSHASDATSDATKSRALHGTSQDTDESEQFDAANDQDLRDKIVATIARRRGQASYRAGLLAAYDGKCCITGCNLVEVLEAAHISPYRGDHSNHPQNGLLLRSDLHALFDLGHLAISDALTVILSSQVRKNSTYQQYHGTAIVLPQRRELRPSLEALQRHRQWTGLSWES